MDVVDVDSEVVGRRKITKFQLSWVITFSWELFAILLRYLRLCGRKAQEDSSRRESRRADRKSRPLLSIINASVSSFYLHSFLHSLAVFYRTLAPIFHLDLLLTSGLLADVILSSDERNTNYRGNLVKSQSWSSSVKRGL